MFAVNSVINKKYSPTSYALTECFYRCKKKFNKNKNIKNVKKLR